VIDANSRRSTTVYDAASRVTCRIDALGKRTTFTFDNAGQQTEVLDPNSITTTTVYDDAGQVQAVVNGLGARTTFVYDDAGQRTGVVDPLGNRTTTVFDDAGKVSSLEDPLGHLTTYSYDNASRRTAIQDAEGKHTTTVYDNASRVEAVVDALGNRTTFVYDNAGQRTAVVDARGYRTTWVYDDAGQVTTKQDALGNRVTLSYDDPGRLLTRLDGRGLTTTLSYDAAGRRTGIQYGDGTRATFTYDSLGRVETMADPSGTTTFGYDDASRQTLVVFPGGKRVTYTFDDGGRRATLVDPDNLTSTYSFDSANRLTGLINGASERTTWAYDSASRLTTLTLANNATVTYSYDSASRTTGVRNAQSGGTAISGFVYTRDNVGNPTAVTLANGDLMTFTYDDNHRLTREQRSGANAYDITYSFDAVGNRTTKVTGGVTTTFTYNEGDQLTVQNAGGTLTTFSFDAAGNNTVVNAAGTRTTYTWDMADRVAGIALSGGALITMAYSASGLRRQRQDGSGTVKYLWDGQVPLMETDGDGTTAAKYTSGTGVPAGGGYGPIVSQRRGNTSRFFHPNDLGTFDTLTDADAATTDTYILDAWGVQHAATGSTTNPFRYIGALGYYTEPDLGLHYVRARWLRPATGSWLSVDPVEGEQRYGYAGGRATRRLDPSGGDGDETLQDWLDRCWAYEYGEYGPGYYLCVGRCYVRFGGDRRMKVIGAIGECYQRDGGEHCRETGGNEDQNRGPLCDELQECFGSKPDAPWCAMLVTKCAWEAGYLLGPGGKRKKAPQPPVTPPPYNTFAHAYGWCEWAKSQGYLHCLDSEADYTPQPGDIVVFGDCQSADHAHHIGVVIGVDDRGCIMTMEGNVCLNPETGEKLRRREGEPCPEGYVEGIGWDLRCPDEGEWEGDKGKFCFIRLPS
jgi:RHS repeat-associated protein